MKTLREYIDIIEQGQHGPAVIDRLPPVLQPTEVPLHVPGGATVVILNDPVTPAEVAIEAVVFGTKLSPEEAYRRVAKAHTQGWAAVASYANYDVAETVAAKIQNHARNNTDYEHYKPLTGHNGPWPLAAEVMDAGQ